MCLAEFASTFRYISSKGQSSTVNVEQDIQGEETTDDTNATTITLQKGLGNMYHRRKPAIIRTHQWSIRKDPEKYYHAQLLLYYPWRNELQDLLQDTFQAMYELCQETIVANKKHYEHHAEELSVAIEQLGNYIIYFKLLSHPQKNTSILFLL